MSYEPDPERLKALDARIRAARGGKEESGSTGRDLSQAHAGWRMVTELVTGIGVGFALGYGLDELFGTTPWLIVLLTLLGFAAGVRVMLGTAREMQRQSDAADKTQAGRPAGREEESRGDGS